MKRILLTLIVLLTSCAVSDESTTTTSLTDAALASTTVELSTTAAILTTTTAAAGAATTSIGVSDFAFSPATVTVSVGDTVAWNLNDGSHTSTSGAPPDGDGMWSQALDPEFTFTFTFTAAGEFRYFCRFHPDFMTGVVIVEP